MDLLTIVLVLSIYFLTLGTIAMVLKRTMKKNPNKMSPEELEEWLIYEKKPSDEE
jgi:hypothetical protein